MKGKINIKDLKKKVAAEEIETIVVAFTDHYGRLTGKRFDADFFLESAVKDGTHGCDYLLTTDMEMEPIEGYEFESDFFMNRCDYLDPALAWTGVKNSGRGVTLSALGYEVLTRPKSFHLKLND